MTNDEGTLTLAGNGIAVRDTPASFDHRVQFYSSESVLIDTVVEFIGPALAEGVTVIAATPAHRVAVTEALGARGIDVVGLIGRRRLLLVDAARLLDELLVDGVLDESGARANLGQTLGSAAAAGTPVRVYGEMVALLWEQGNVQAAIALEDVWNSLAERHVFALLCGYPAPLFSHGAAGDRFSDLCDLHTQVVLEPGPDRTARWEFPAKLTSGALARRQLRELLKDWKVVDLLDDAELLATELITNAVLHAGSHVVVTVSQLRNVVRVAVTDSGVGHFRPRNNGVEGTSGRGLMLVNALSASWGTSVEAPEKTVWFELRR